MADHHLVFLGLKGGCTGSSESTLIKMSLCRKSHVAAHLCLLSHLRVSGFCIYIALYIQTYHYNYTYRGNKQFGTEYCAHSGIKYEYCATNLNKFQSIINI